MESCSTSRSALTSIRAVGWMVAADTQTPALASAFSGAPSTAAFANGGMWASGGPAVDAQGNVYSTTGNGTLDTTAVPGYWAQSVLVWGPGSPLRLVGTYTPWNYCQMDQTDIDLAGGAAIVLPDLGAANTSTPHLITFGGKQGNQYLVDRDHMPGSLVSRAACSNDPATDRSLTPPGPQPQFGKPGPLNVFGPYSENFGSLDYARGRSTGAFFRSADGGNFLFVSGSTKAAPDSQQTAPPCIVKLRINTSPGRPAYLSVEASENSFSFLVARLALGHQQRRQRCDCLDPGRQRGSQHPARRPRCSTSNSLRAESRDSPGPMDQHALDAQRGRQVQYAGVWSWNGVRGNRSHSGVRARGKQRGLTEVI